MCLKESMLEAMFEYAMLYHGQTGQAIQVSQGDTALKEIPDFPPGKVNAIPDFPGQCNRWV